jgi:hypothetical protein
VECQAGTGTPLHALWINPSDGLRLSTSPPLFLVCEPDFAPAQPLRLLKGWQLSRLAGGTIADWMRQIRLLEASESLAHLKLQPGMTMDQVCWQ